MSRTFFKNQLLSGRKNCLLVLLICSVVFNATLFAQSARELAEMYRNHQIEKLDALRNSDKIRQDDWRLFINALFMDDAETATIEMMRAYSSASDRELKTIIRKRVSQYYSAKGYYETARKIAEDEHSFLEIVSIKIKDAPKADKPAPFNSTGQNRNEDLFGIQLGAYSSYANAESTSRQYQSQYSNTQIIQKSRNGETLYIVVIGDYRSRGDAEKALPQVNQTFNVNGYIIQY